MLINVGIEYDDNGYIYSALWWPGKSPRPKEVGRDKFKVVNMALTHIAETGETLYGIAMDYSKPEKTLLQPGEVREMLGEWLYRKEAEAANHIIYLPLKDAKWRTIKIPYYDSETAKKMMEIKTKAKARLAAENGRPRLITTNELKMLQLYSENIYDIFDTLRDVIRTQHIGGETFEIVAMNVDHNYAELKKLLNDINERVTLD